MPYSTSLLPIPLDGTGTEIPALNVTDSYDTYEITGSVTTSGNYAIVPTGTPQAGTTFEFDYNAVVDITTNGNTFSIFGVSLNQTQLLTKLKIVCRYDGSAWKVRIWGSLDQAIISSISISSNSITTAKIVDDSITDAKLATMTAASLKYGDASGNPGNLALGNDQIAVGNGSTIIAVDKTTFLANANGIVSIPIPVSFESGEQTTTITCWFPPSNQYYLSSVLVSVIDDIAATDDAVININIDGNSIIKFNTPNPNSTIVIPASTTAGNAILYSGTSVWSSSDRQNTNAISNYLNIEATKSTPGGKVIATLILHSF